MMHVAIWSWITLLIFLPGVMTFLVTTHQHQHHCQHQEQQDSSVTGMRLQMAMCTAAQQDSPLG
jgi:hypothetical protein